MEDINETNPQYMPATLGYHDNEIKTILTNRDCSAVLTGDSGGKVLQYRFDGTWKLQKNYGDLEIGAVTSSTRLDKLAVFGGEKFIRIIDIEAGEFVEAPLRTAVKNIYSVQLCAISTFQVYLTVTGLNVDYERKETDLFDVSRLIKKMLSLPNFSRRRHARMMSMTSLLGRGGADLEVQLEVARKESDKGPSSERKNDAFLRRELSQNQNMFKKMKIRLEGELDKKQITLKKFEAQLNEEIDHNENKVRSLEKDFEEELRRKEEKMSRLESRHAHELGKSRMRLEEVEKSLQEELDWRQSVIDKQKETIAELKLCNEQTENELAELKRKYDLDLQLKEEEVTSLKDRIWEVEEFIRKNQIQESDKTDFNLRLPNYSEESEEEGVDYSKVELLTPQEVDWTPNKTSNLFELKTENDNIRTENQELFERNGDLERNLQIGRASCRERV